MADSTVDFAELKCLRCQEKMTFIGQLPLRTGGVSGFWSQYGEPFEKIVELYTYRCSNCGKVEFYDLDMKLPPHPLHETEEQEWE